MGIRDEIAHVLGDLEAARTEPFSGHPIAARIRIEATDAVRSLVDDDTLLVKGSAGSGGWAEVVWIAVFDTLVTTSAMRGFYVVWLFRPDGEGVHLALATAMTEALEEAGANYVEALEARCHVLASLLGEPAAEGLIKGPIDLGASTRRALGYEAGIVLSTYFARDSLPNDAVLEAHLRRFLELYALLIEAVDEDASESDRSDNSTLPGGDPRTEARKVRWHRRVERNAALVRKAKAIHGDRCQVCGFKFSERYGEIGEGFIEAHHLTPIASLAGRPTTLDPNDDFAVLCSNCHRMIHRGPPFSLEELKSQIAP